MAEARPPILNLRSVRDGPERCSLCRDDIRPQDAQTCADCDTSYHASCLREFGPKCATAGCGAEIGTLEISLKARAAQPLQEATGQEATGPGADRTGKRTPSTRAWTTASVLSAVAFCVMFMVQGQQFEWPLLFAFPVCLVICAYVVDEVLTSVP